MIHQHFTLVPAQTVLENIVVASDTGGGPFLDERTARRRVRELQDRFGLLVDPDARVWTLAVGEQQRVEILKALYRNAEILIMDEPTAVLAPAETVELFKTLRSLVAEGRSVIFISHKLNEVMEISDRVVVLRGGRVVAERLAEETNARELASLMVGREVLERLERSDRTPGANVLEVTGLTVGGDRGLEAVRNIDLTVRSGEILALAGVSGNGQRELAEVLFGLRKPVSGEIRVDGKILPSGRPSRAIRAGMGRIPEDRIDTGLLTDLSVEDNLILESHGSRPYSRRGLMQYRRVHKDCERMIADYGVKAAGRDAAAKTLSGGNLQKLILARELSGNPRLVVAAQPTRGLDVGAMEYVHQRILEERARGAAVLLISEDLEEVFNLSDRIAVIYEGRIMGEVPTDRASRDRIGLWMSGIAEED
jgi:simple sugar transport system ATP-binding protein